MKIFRASLMLVTLFVMLPLCAQNNAQIDSLTKEYKSPTDDRHKLQILDLLFKATYKKEVDQASTYVTEQFALAKKLDLDNELAQAAYNFGLYHNQKSQKDSAFYFFEMAHGEWKKQNDLKNLLKANNALAGIEYDMGNTEKALELVNSNLKVHDSINEITNAWGNDFTLKGNIYQSFGDHKTALENFLEAEKIYQQTNEKALQALSLDNIGYLEMLEKNLTEAIEYTKEAAVIYEEVEDYSLLARAYQTIGIINVYLENRAEAKAFFERSLPIAKKSGSMIIESKAYDYLGGLLVEDKKIDEGLPYLLKSTALIQKTGKKNLIAHSLINLGLAYFDKQDYTNSIRYFNEAKTVADSIDNQGGVAQKVLGYRSKAYEASKDFEKALNDYKTYTTNRDTILNKEKVKQIEEMRAKFDTERKEQQIAQQESDIALLEVKEKVSTQQKWLLGGGLGLSLLVVGFGFYSFRQKTKRNQLEKEKVETELAFKKKELTTHALHLAKKNEILEELKQKAKQLKASEQNNKGYQELIKTITFDQQDDKNWDSFTQYFEQVHKDFASNVKRRYPEVTKNELRFMALLKMSMSSKEIATILNISPDGVKKARQRLRKKMQLTPQESLENTVLNI